MRVGRPIAAPACSPAQADRRDSVAAGQRVARRGLTRIDLVVVLLVLGIVFCGLVLALNRAREEGRRTQCSNNLRQLGLGLLNFATSKNRFPNAGTFFDDPRIHQGDPTRSVIYRSIVNPGSFYGSTTPGCGAG